MARDDSWLIALGVAVVIGGVLLWRRRAAAEELPDDEPSHDQEEETPMSDVASAPAPAAPRADLPGPFRRFRLTEYWVAQLLPGDVEIFDTEGASLGKISEKSKKDLDLEGSGRLPDGRVVAYTGKSGVYKLLPEGVLATGYRGRALTPWRSVAADLGDQGGKKPWMDSITRGGPFLTPGTKLFIQELAGRRLPDGSDHDGWVTVEDSGGAIFGAHLDLFVGERSGRLQHPTIVNVAGPGFENIPENYTYGLTQAPDRNYKAMRPPGTGAAS